MRIKPPLPISAQAPQLDAATQIDIKRAPAKQHQCIHQQQSQGPLMNLQRVLTCSHGQQAVRGWVPGAQVLPLPLCLLSSQLQQLWHGPCCLHSLHLASPAAKVLSGQLLTSQGRTYQEQGATKVI